MPMVKKPQIDKFRETARALETDEDEGKFDAALRKVAAHKPDPKSDITPSRKSRDKE